MVLVIPPKVKTLPLLICSGVQDSYVLKRFFFNPGGACRWEKTQINGGQRSRGGKRAFYYEARCKYGCATQYVHMESVMTYVLNLSWEALTKEALLTFQPKNVNVHILYLKCYLRNKSKLIQSAESLYTFESSGNKLLCL